MSDIPDTNDLNVAQTAVAWEIVWKAFEEGDFDDNEEPAHIAMTNAFIDVFRAIKGMAKIETEE